MLQLVFAMDISVIDSVLCVVLPYLIVHFAHQMDLFAQFVNKDMDYKVF